MNDFSIIIFILIYYVNVIKCSHRILQSNSNYSYNNNCPVSSLIDTIFDGLHSYPIDIFDESLVISSGNPENLGHDKYGDILFNCSSSDRTEIIHTCVNNNFKPLCPISDVDLKIATNKTNQWNYQHNLCKFHDVMHEPKAQGRIIILGGSVTEGSSSDHCCCDGNIELKCNNTAPFIDYHSYCINNNFCSWVNSFRRWVKTKTFNNIQIHKLSMGGATSPFMAERLSDKLRDNHIPYLNSSDIILIDHSVNDGMSFYQSTKYHLLVQGLETLIRRIYHHSEPNSWPTVILLEHWPYTQDRVKLSYRPNENNKELMAYDYSKAYVKIAKYYKLPLWSYRDIVWSDQIEKRYSRDKLDYFRFILNPEFGYQHPPWYIHLYYADMIAKLLLNEMIPCIYNNTNSHIRRNEDMNVDKLPTPMYHSDSYQCLENSSPSLYLTAKHLYQNTSLEQLVGRFERSPVNSWKLSEDRPNKFGWIDEFDTEQTKSDVSTNITFYFNNSNNLILSQPYLIQIHYLRTYLNGGLVDMYLCDKRVESLDALWNDYRTYHISMYMGLSFIVDESDWGTRNLCFNHSIGTLTFTHTSVSRKSNDPVLIKARGKEKFKLVSIRICAKGSTE